VHHDGLGIQPTFARNIVPFPGVYPSAAYPFSLPYGMMDRIDLIHPNTNRLKPVGTASTISAAVPCETLDSAEVIF